MTRPSWRSQTPIVSERVRRTAGQSFAFLPHRFLRDGFFGSLSSDELRLYVLLLLAADRFGVSFYHADSICSLLRLSPESYLELRDELIRKDLIAFDGVRFQVLSLPKRPASEPPRRTKDKRAAAESSRPPARSRSADSIDHAHLHRKAHPIPSEHPHCQDCRQVESTRQSLRDAIATLEARARARSTVTDREEEGEEQIENSTGGKKK